LQGSNPTWFKRPRRHEELVSFSKEELMKALRDTIDLMLGDIANYSENLLSEKSLSTVTWGNSEQFSLQNRSVDLVLTSPPYCTRIDYAIATVGELAVMGIGSSSGLDELRSRLMGTTKVPQQSPVVEMKWGKSCIEFIRELEEHRSVASTTYYLKNHTQYFQSLSKSIGCISKSLKREGICVMVAQDSFYKDIHNDLPTIISEMCENEGLVLFQKEDFQLQTTLSHINKKSKEYIQQKATVESVLCFYKP
jgi:hypothetical protein